jgi:PKD repeat protein
MRLNRESLAFVLVAGILLSCSGAGAAQVFSTSVPVCFIENNGQTDEQVLYLADAAGYTLYLTREGEVIRTAEPASVITVSYTGSNPAATVSPEDELAGKANYFIGDEEQWVSNVPMFGSVRYEELYDGITLVYHGGPSLLKREFIVAPGADPSAIRMQYAGQETLTLDEGGALLIATAAGTFFETPPVCYQDVAGEQVVVTCSYVVADEGAVTFSLGAYDRTLPLIIDPVYDFSTYLGGTQEDWGAGVGMDDGGNVYIAGSTQSTQFPLGNWPPYQQQLNGSWDIFVTKFSPDGGQIVYSTYIGGNSTDTAGGMAVRNDTGEVFITGTTVSLNFPSNGPGSIYPYEGYSDAFITAVDASGSALLWSTYVGGNMSDEGTAIALDPFGNPTIVGTTASDIFPLVTGALNGATDAFVANFDTTGTCLWGTYLGGTNYDYGYGVAIEDATTDVWVTGATRSLNFPLNPANPPYPFRSNNAGGVDVFITKMNPGGVIQYSTYLGGSANDWGTAIAVDSNGYPYVTGYTDSPVSPISLFPIKPVNQAFQTTYGGGNWDAFVTKMEPNLSMMNYSTYLGGLYEDKAFGIAVDSLGTAFVTGYTMSENFPTKYPLQPAKGAGYMVPDAFITQVNQTGTGLLFSTYLGGTYYDQARAIAITDDGLNITVTGLTDSVNFPLVNAYQPYLAGYSAVRFKDAFLTKIVKLPPIANFTAVPVIGCSPLTVYFNDTSSNTPTSWFWEFGDGNTSTEQYPNNTYTATGSTTNYTVNLTACNLDGCGFISQVDFITVCPQPFADFAANQTTGCLNLGNTTVEFNLTSYGGDVNTGPEPSWNWSFGDGTFVDVDFSTINVTHTYTTEGLFNVSLTYNNTCCQNTTMKVGYVDIGDVPVADFYATPTSGLVPLNVDFFDNSTGRPTSWTWFFGAGEGGSNLQNPDHTYAIKGAYSVELQACNFCGCDWENKTAYIRAGVPNLTFIPQNLTVPTNDTTPISLVLQAAENGVSGYDLNVFWDDSAHGDMVSVTFPPWAANSSATALPSWFVQILAVDLTNQVTPGATNIPLATFNLTGNISTFQSTIGFNVSVNELDDDFGNPIYTNNLPATITVVRLLPFPGPGITGVPTDPYGDQKYWDVNGNGGIDFADVVKYFQNMQWIRNNQYVPFFDYNGNGLIDFADLIMLFNKV